MSDLVNFATIGRRVRRHFPLIVVWALTAAGLFVVWRPQPRFTLDGSDIAEFVAVTADSRSLVALTNRKGTIRHGNTAAMHDFASGPIQIVDLYTGRRRMMALPEQRTDGSFDPESWMLSFPVEPISGRLCNLIQTNFWGQRWAVKLDLERGVTTKTRLPDLKRQLRSTKTTLSRKCRWIADVREPEADARNSDAELRVIDAATGTVVFTYSSFDTPKFYFSDDEKLLAVVEPNLFDDDATTVIRRLEPLKVLRSIDRRLSSIRFSPSHRSFACIDRRHVSVFDVETGDALNRFTLRGKISNQRLEECSPKQFRFSSDERFLIGYDFYRGSFSGGQFRHCLVSVGSVQKKYQFLGGNVASLAVAR